MSPAPKNDNSAQAVNAVELKKYMSRVEKLIEDRKAVQEDIKEVKAEAKAKGFDMKAFNEMLKLRALDSEKRREQEELRDCYMSAIGLC